MIEIAKKLYIGDLNAYLVNVNSGNLAFVHATQTIHYRIMGWDRRFNKPNKNHPNYIYWEKDNRLSLNWVDGEAFLYNWSGQITFIKVLNFIENWINIKEILIHCDQGQSRSPTLRLLFLAKRRGILPNNTYSDAYKEFIKLYLAYQPGGIGEYVNIHWEEIA